MTLFGQVLTGLAAIAAGVVLTRLWESIKLLRRFGYVRRFIGHYRKVQIVVSSVGVSAFRYTVRDDDPKVHVVHVPRNVLYMPMPEGRAIASLVSFLHRVDRRLKIQLVTPANHDPTILTMSIGGPSVNSFTHKLLGAEFPEFSIDYPATKRARFEGHSFETLRNANDEVTRDYGFIFAARTTGGAPCLVFCGIRAFGSAMAVQLFQSLPYRSDAKRLLQQRAQAMIVAAGKVDGLEWSAVHLDFCREVPSVTRRMREPA